MTRTISILLPDLAGGGAERISLVVANEFARAGYDVEFVLMQARGELLDGAQESFSVVDLATPRARDLPFTLAKYLRHRKPSALMAAMWPLTVIAPVAARLSGHRCKVLVSEHNTLSMQYRDWGRFHRAMLRTTMALGYRLADSRVCVSKGLARDVAALSGLQPHQFDVIYNPVPPRPEPSRAAVNAAEDLWAAPSGARLVTVGSMEAQKNHALLLRAFAHLERPDARLMFVGDGTGRDALKSLARELGISDRVILTGFQLDPAPFYRTADVFALSSDYEGFGNVIIEAMACGTPVVSTDCPSGPSEILDGGKYGLLVPTGDAKALAEAINSALESDKNIEQLKLRAADFTPAIAAARYLSLLGI